MHINAVREDITPPFAVQLGGYRSQRGDQQACEVAIPLELHALMIRWGEERSVMISFDLIWLSAQFSNHLKRWMANKFGIPAERVLLAATHTHSSPQLIHRAEFYGQVDPAYEDFLLRKSKAAIRRLMSTAQRAHLYFGRNRSHKSLIVNRNELIRDPLNGGKQVIQTPNRARSIEHELDLIKLNDENDQPVAMIVRAACHPVFHKDNLYSADYPGRLRQLIWQEAGRQFPILFLQGFAGDLRPNFHARRWRERLEQLINTKSLRPGFAKDLTPHLDRFVTDLAGELPEPEALVTKPESQNEPQHRIFHCSGKNGGEEGEQSFYIQRFDIHSQLSFLAINAEVYSQYELILRALEERLNKIIIPVGYTHGMVGYLPDNEVLTAANGYEYESWHKFGLDRPYQPEVAQVIEAGIHKCFYEA
ncbi:MAG: hypothetical protein ACQETE_15530 [Bacteroidota bacterium]